MAKKHTVKKILTAASKPENSVEATATQSPESAKIAPPGVSREEKVRLLAYSHWIERGCRDGSPDEDWFRAEREVDLSS